MKPWPLLAIALVLAGCSKPNPLLGKYKAAYSGNLADKAPMVKDMVDTSYIVLKDNNAFDMVLVAPQSGKWKQEGSNITVTPDHIGSLEIPEGQQKPMQLKVSADGKTLTPTDGSSSGADLTFVKQ